MPTINQLVRQGRTDKTTKSNSPALNRGYNSLAKKATSTKITSKSVVCVLVLLLWHLKKPNSLYVNMPVLDYQMVWK